MKNFPRSFADPIYASADQATENNLGLPIGLLSSIREHGERTNADRVSSAGATTPYQFIPATRKALLDKYGIDVTANPESASQGAGILLKESLERNKGDAELAVREYHGGLNKANWGPINDAYAKRVMGAQELKRSDVLSNDFAEFMKANPAIAQRAPEQTNQAEPSNNLSRDFGAFLAQQPQNVVGENIVPERRDLLINQIPGMAAAPAITKSVEPTLGEKIIGAGEAGLTALTGAIGGTAGMLTGTAKGIIDSIRSGTFGTQQGVQNTENEAAALSSAWTRAPRTQAGQEYVGKLADIASALPPILGIGPALSSAAQSVRTSLPAIKGETAMLAKALSPTKAVTPAVEAAPNVVPPKALAAALQAPESFVTPELPSPKKKLSINEQQANIDTMKEIGLTSQRPSAITGDKFTAGQEYQHAKLDTPSGDILRNQLAEEQTAIKNFGNNIIKNTGSVAASPDETGQLVRAPLKALSEHYDQESRALYQTADKRAQGLASFKPTGFKDLIDTDSKFLRRKDDRSLRDGIRAYMNEIGIMKDGELQPINAQQAEHLRQYLNESWTPQNSRLIGEIKEKLDLDVAKVGGQDLYKAARKLHAERKNTLDNPKGIASLLNEKGPEGINKLVPDEKVGNKLLSMPNEQFNHVIKTLSNLPEHLQAEGNQALSEIKGILARKLYSAGDAGGTQHGPSIWNAANTTKELNALSAKLRSAFSPEELNQFQTLNRAGHILQTPSAYPGAAAQTHGLMARGAIYSPILAGGALGSVIGGPVSGALGSALGLHTSRKLAKTFEARMAKKLSEQLLNPKVQ